MPATGATEEPASTTKATITEARHQEKPKTEASSGCIDEAILSKWLKGWDKVDATLDATFAKHKMTAITAVMQPISKLFGQHMHRFPLKTDDNNEYHSSSGRLDEQRKNGWIKQTLSLRILSSTRTRF